ncbi:MAG: hypothetical protein OXC13_18410 [Caldilineaceae bacterium]|nr:hypothetical protein [Caldilineaceae bacterium]
MAAHTVVPALDLSSLSGLADAHVYGSPALRIDTADLCERAGQDLTYLFTLIRDHSGFDPWTIQSSDFRF